MKIISGIRQEHIPAAVDLYWHAFGEKLDGVLWPEPKAKAFIARVLDPAHAISAVDTDGSLLGVAGFKTYDGAFVGGGFRDLFKVFGLKSLWQMTVLTLLQRDVENTRFLMDGICVAPEARGRGIGTALLRQLYVIAQERGHQEIRLDVIDSNPRARALYQREGFKSVGEVSLGPLRWIFGFRTSAIMVRPVP